MLDDSNLVQYVTSAMYIAGHTLDYVITRIADDIIVAGTVTVTILFSDRLLFYCSSLVTLMQSVPDDF